ncbi:MAG: RluA family pseudouridine synthase [Rhodospirillales bacterium]|nr:RluA family pseudouridine synthase [Rhodospirillales bacterium]
MPAGEAIRLTVEAEAAGQRIDRYLTTALAGHLPAISRSRIKALIAQGCVSDAAGTLGEASGKVKQGQQLTLALPPPEPAEPQAQAIDLTVVHEDEDLIVVDKPAGMVVHPAPGSPDGTLVNALMAHCGDSLQGVGAVRRPGIVHRLDKNTSGLLVVAKNDLAHRGLIRQFLERSVKRFYQALVWGLPQEMEGRIDGNIGRHPKHRQKMASLRQGGRPAVTHYCVVAVLAGGLIAQIRCRLETGRTHQIRVHLAEQGHGLIGDPLYGRMSPARRAVLPTAVREAVEAFGRQALHAEVLGFHHPRSGTDLEYRSSLPEDHRSLLDMLSKESSNNN